MFASDIGQTSTTVEWEFLVLQCALMARPFKAIISVVRVDSNRPSAVPPELDRMADSDKGATDACRYYSFDDN